MKKVLLIIVLGTIPFIGYSQAKYPFANQLPQFIQTPAYNLDFKSIQDIASKANRRYEDQYSPSQSSGKTFYPEMCYIKHKNKETREWNEPLLVNPRPVIEITPTAIYIDGKHRIQIIGKLSETNDNDVKYIAYSCYSEVTKDVCIFEMNDYKKQRRNVWYLHYYKGDEVVSIAMFIFYY